MCKIDITDVFDAAGDVVKGVGDLATDIIKGADDLVTDITTGVVKEVGGVAGDVVKGVGGVAGDVVKGVGGVAGDVVKGVGGVATDIIKGADDLVTDIVKGVGGVATDVVKGAEDVADEVGDALARVDDFVNDITWRNEAKAREAEEKRHQLQEQAQFTNTNYQKFYNRQMRLAQIREARLRRARAISSAVASGAGIGSSNITGVLGSLGTQTAFNEAKIINANLVGNYLSGLNKEIGYQSYLFNKAQMNQQYQMQMFDMGMKVGSKLFGSLLTKGASSGSAG